MTKRDIGFEEALPLTLQQLEPLPPKSVPLWEATGLVLARDAVARVNSPSLTTSSRDGFAVRSGDVARATPDSPVRLKVTATLVAGGVPSDSVREGTAIKVMTGAPLPEGSDAVVAVEFTKSVDQGDGAIDIMIDAAPARNVQARGLDVTEGETLAETGDVLTPAMTGLLAAGGYHEISVFPPPRVAVVATGDEVVAPAAGAELDPGQLFASNLVTLRSWLQRFQMPSQAALATDDPAELERTIGDVLNDVDVVLTSGGAWKSARDRSAEVLERLGFELIYHRVRLAPGKAIAFGVRGQQIAFCLPGGPPSNEMAFLQLALPALRRMAGYQDQAFRRREATLTESVRKNRSDPTWTNFVQASLHQVNGELRATPCRHRSRLVCQANAEALIEIPVGTLELECGSVSSVQILQDL